MKLYNTLTKKVEPFEPAGETVSLYSCGPTVYDYAHLGNLRAYVFTDTLRRTLEASGYRLKHVMNITDVGHLASDGDEGEDKLEKGAGREGKSVWEVAEFYSDAFKRDVSRLNILPPNGYKDPKRGDEYARATDFIAQQIDMVKLLLEKGFAYKSQQAIYFDVSKLEDYGQLTGQDLKEKEVAARSEVVTDESKRHPQDFALWFFTVGRFAGHSMHWDSPWGEGFPGWHLECSAIVHAIFQEPIDIHTGGVDHIGTHHTNEIAQTKAAFDKQLSRFWLHNEHMLVDGKKMSKSLGNFFTLEDVIKKGYDPLALRLLFLQSHYRSQSNFTWKAMEAAQNRLVELRRWADLRWQPKPTDSGTDYSLLEQKVVEIIQEDLDSPKALAYFSGVVKDLNEVIFPGNQAAFVSFLETLDSIFGLSLSSRSDISDAQKSWISSREAARKNQDWAEADQLRTKLGEEGIEINDTVTGPIWSRVR